MLIEYHVLFVYVIFLLFKKKRKKRIEKKPEIGQPGFHILGQTGQPVSTVAVRAMIKP